MDLKAAVEAVEDVLSDLGHSDDVEVAELRHLLAEVVEVFRDQLVRDDVEDEEDE